MLDPKPKFLKFIQSESFHLLKKHYSTVSNRVKFWPLGRGAMIPKSGTYVGLHPSALIVNHDIFHLNNPRSSKMDIANASRYRQSLLLPPPLHQLLPCCNNNKAILLRLWPLPLMRQQTFAIVIPQEKMVDIVEPEHFIVPQNPFGGELILLAMS